MKDLGKIKYCFGLQIEHSENDIFMHQSTYSNRVLKRFTMDKPTVLSTLMVIRSINVKK